MSKFFYTAQEVSDLIGVSKSQAYIMMQEWNKELASKGFITIAGKVSKKYLQEKIYGYNDGKEAI
ncbi:DNA-binding protein [uncultured Ruminococcus sp.]|mgnify:FL=1|uniref:DNA-binding protein n=1 Tax=uncultured Ruminococcus sp. TaxID=165186 RepID=UPI0025885E89|nr:DNA-binding protein [uncultured Ruminococcus sp.]